MSAKDEHYVLDICDRVLGLKSKRQFRFEFLRGDSGRKLPVDAYYPEINLVIEFHERQHQESVRFFDKPEKMTCSGVHRGEQRRIYDERRRSTLPANGIQLIVLTIGMFQHDRQKRLKRSLGADEKIIRKQLAFERADA